MGNFSLYLLTNGKFGQTSYFVVEDFKINARYFSTQNHKANYFLTENFKKRAAYFLTANHKFSYIITEDFKKKAAYFLTSAIITKYFLTEILDIDDFTLEDNPCIYPSEVEEIRFRAIKLYHSIIEDLLKSSIDKEKYGKICTSGHNKTGMMRVLIDYLSSIWLERDADSKSGLVRTSDYYYTKYNVYEVIKNFRECGLNIKPIVALFDLNSYSIEDSEWPNYFMMNAIVNPPVQSEKKMRQWTDIFTLQAMTPDKNQAIKPLAANQTSFFPTKTIKYFSAFTINGVDYTGYTDYNANSITYSPSIAFGYNIVNSDTVILTYWYEE
jgi:hypothetical protein